MDIRVEGAHHTAWKSEYSFDSFTLYFLAYDHSGGTLSAKELKDSRFNREGTSSRPVFVSSLAHPSGTQA